MKALTADDVYAWCGARSVAVSSDNYLYFELNRQCIAVDLPKKPYEVVALVNELLPYTVNNPFEGALLWLREWGIWSELVERAGFRVMELLRRADGVIRSPEEAPRYLFDALELVDLQVGLLQPVLIGWDAFMVPDSGDYIVATSHDETTCILTRTLQLHEKLLADLKSWNCQSDPERYFSHKAIPVAAVK